MSDSYSPSVVAQLYSQIDGPVSSGSQWWPVPYSRHFLADIPSIPSLSVATLTLTLQRQACGSRTVESRPVTDPPAAGPASVISLRAGGPLPTLSSLSTLLGITVPSASPRQALAGETRRIEPGGGGQPNGADPSPPEGLTVEFSEDSAPRGDRGGWFRDDQHRGADGSGLDLSAPFLTVLQQGDLP